MKKLVKAIKILLNLGYTTFNIDESNFSAMYLCGNAGKEELYVSVENGDYYEKEYFDLGFDIFGSVTEIIENPKLTKQEVKAVKLLLKYLNNRKVKIKNE